MVAARLGVIGGTFDPIHIGHLAVAEDVRVRLALDQVLFVPAGQPPHKPDQTILESEHRLRMLELALADNPNFELSRVDIDRPGPCYTVDTLAILLEQRGPGTELFFIMGTDSLSELLSWHDPARLIRLCRIAAVFRPGYVADLDVLEASLPGLKDRVIMVPAARLDISSSDLRDRVRAGWPIRYLVPAPVEAYIRQHGLYRH